MTLAVLASALVLSQAPALDARIDAALAADSVRMASAAADTALRLRAARFKRDPSAEPAYLDTLWRRFFAAGTPAAIAQATRYAERALALREKALGPDHLDVARTSSTLSVLREYQGDWTGARRDEERSLSIRLRLRGERDPLVASSWLHLGKLDYLLGHFASAESLFRRSLAVYETVGDPYAARVPEALNDLGEACRAQDRFTEAEIYFRRGLDSLRADNPRHDTMRRSLVNNLGGVYKDLSRYDEAAPLLEEALQLATAPATPDPRDLAAAHLNLGEVYRLQGRAAEAEPHYAQGLAYARALFEGDNPYLVLFINQAAVLDRELGRYAAAESLFREAQGVVERTVGADHPLVAQNLNDLAGLLTDQGRYAEAEAAYGRALAIREQRLGANHPDAAVTRVDLARCLSLDPGQGDSVAAPVLDRGLAVLDSSRAYPESRLDGYALLARMRRRAGDPLRAMADLAVALESVDALRAIRGGGDATRAAFVAKYLGLYHLMVEWRLEAGDGAGALDTHERARARLLLDQLASSGVDIRAGVPADVLRPLDAAEEEARGRLARAQRRLAEVRDADLSEAERLERTAALEAARDSAAWDFQRARDAIQDRSPIWRELLQSGGHPASVKAIQREALARDEWMLVYDVGDDASFVFAIPPGGKSLKWYSLVADGAGGPVTGATLAHAIAGPGDASAFHATLGVADLLSGKRPAPMGGRRVSEEAWADTLTARLEALGRSLVPAALWSKLKGARGAVIVPDGALHLLPFEALVMRPAAGRGTARYWLDDGPALRYVSSATSAVGLAQRSASRAPVDSPHGVVSVANPSFARDTTGTATWAPLPGTVEESRRVRAAFAAESVTVLQGLDATERNVRAALPGRRVLHFATHAFVTQQHGDLLAGLVLTPPQPGAAERDDDDGQLQLFEIYELRLDCALAVLSACETQRGPLVQGEGVFALSRGFIAAGAGRVVASLWPVGDASTASLMGDFMGGVAAARDPDYAVALRQAKRRLREQAPWSAPFYWAPFVLTGER